MPITTFDQLLSALGSFLWTPEDQFEAPKLIQGIYQTSASLSDDHYPICRFVFGDPEEGDFGNRVQLIMINDQYHQDKFTFIRLANTQKWYLYGDPKLNDTPDNNICPDMVTDTINKMFRWYYIEMSEDIPALFMDQKDLIDQEQDEILEIIENEAESSDEFLDDYKIELTALENIYQPSEIQSDYKIKLKTSDINLNRELIDSSDEMTYRKDIIKNRRAVLLEILEYPNKRKAKNYGKLVFQNAAIQAIELQVEKKANRSHMFELLEYWEIPRIINTSLRTHLAERMDECGPILPLINAIQKITEYVEQYGDDCIKNWWHQYITHQDRLNLIPC